MNAPMNSLNNGMVVVPILTPYGTQLVPMSVNQLLGSGMGARMNGTDMNSLTQSFQQQQAANLRNIQGNFYSFLTIFQSQFLKNL